MNRRQTTGLVLGLLFVLGVPVSAQTNQAELIRNFKSTITVNTNSTIHVEEDINYDFGSNQKHGIYRDVTLTSSTGKPIILRNISVTDGSNNPYNFTVNTANNNEQIKIGDANTLISGEHEYRIQYDVTNAVAKLDSLDEIYWNATGNSWQVPIENTDVKVILPSSIQSSDLQISCYYGSYGTNASCGGEPTKDANNGVREVVFPWSNTLNPGSGLTVAVGFPKGILLPPTFFEELVAFVEAYIYLLLPILTLIIMFCLWWKNGRDPKGSGVIVAEYDAPNSLTPLEIAGVLDTSIANSKISAEIIYLATLGYLKITRIEKKVLFTTSTDYEITLLKDYSDIKNVYDADIMLRLFPAGFNRPTVKISELKNTFYSFITVITGGVYNSLTAKGFYKKNPQAVMSPFSYIWVVCFFASYFIVRLKVFEATISLELMFSAVLCGLIVLLFSKIMPSKTKEGALLEERILGFKEYLQIAEKDRINFHNAPEKNPALFEKLLPYAMVLGVEKAWAKEFEGIYLTQPSWYNDPYHNGMFTAVMLTNNLGNFNSFATSNIASSPRGGSGGGGGGGGGGSW